VCGEISVGSTGQVTLFPILRGANRHDPGNNGSYTGEVLPYRAYAGKAVCAQLNFSRIHMPYAEYYRRQAAAAAAVAAAQRAEVDAAGWGGSRCCRVENASVLAALDLASLTLCNCSDELALAPLLLYPTAVRLLLSGSIVKN
jgi:hypothetical protein